MSLEISPLIVTSSAVVAGVLFYFLKSLNSRKKNKINLPPKGPTFGEFFPEGIKAENQSSLILKYGNVFTVPSPLPGIVPNQVIINEPKLVKELCVQQANMYRQPSNFTTRPDVFASATRKVVGTGVTGLKGDEWYWRKKALLKEFHRNRMLSDDRGLVSVVIDEGKLLCEELGKAADNDLVVTVDHLTTKAAVGVVLFFLFGRKLDFDTNQMRMAAKDMIDCLFARLSSPLYELLKYIPNTSAYKAEVKMTNSQKVIDNVVALELNLLLDEFHKRKPVHPDRMEGSVMASLIENEPRFRTGGVDAMLSEARVFVQAGFETTAHSLAFAIGMMTERPDLADDIARQGMNVFQDKDRETTEELHKDVYYSVEKMNIALERTPLVKNFFYEALRLYPLAPALGGECSNDIDIVTKDGTQYTLPKGTAVTFPNMPLQRQVPDPDEIRPERWDVPPSERPFLHTFQHGAHACPGKPLSLLEGHIFLLLVAIQFKFDFPAGVEKVEYEDTGLLRPRNGMPLLVKRRAKPTAMEN